MTRNGSRVLAPTPGASPLVPPASGKAALEALITGFALDPQAVGRRLQALASPVVPGLRDAASLSDAERRLIQDRHRLDPLPEKWFFDGTAYLDWNNDGARSATHPLLAEFAQLYVDEINNEAAAAVAGAAIALQCVEAREI